MDDKNFDKAIRQSLLSYQNETSASVGWSRLNLPVQKVGAVKSWLVGSVIVNVVLFAALGYLYFGQESLEDRLQLLENRSYNIENRFVGPELAERIDITVESDNSSFNEPPSVTSFESIGLLASNGSSGIINRDEEEILVADQRNLIQLSRIDGLPPKDFEPFNLYTSDQPQESKERVKLPKKLAKLDRGTLIELEKNRFGKGVQIEPAAVAITDYNQANNGYSGIGMGIGGELQLRFHPFWSLNPAIQYTRMNLNSTSENIQSEWTNYFQFNYIGELIKSHRGINLIKIPILLERHIPINQNNSLRLGVGVNTNIQFSQKINFESRELEHEEDHEFEEEEEYHYFTESYHESGLKIFSTVARYEMVLGHRIKKTAFYWKTGIYYEQAFSGLDLSNNLKTYGFTAMFSRK